MARYARHHRDRQLVIALSVPARDFAAVLLGCGWTLMSSPPPLDPPLEVLRDLKPGAPVRVVTRDYVLLTRFRDSMGDGAFVRFGDASRYQPGKQILAVCEVPCADKAAALPRVPPGTIGALSPRRLARPTADLALVGTVKRLREDMEEYLTCEDVPAARPTRLADLLLPESPGAATWSTRLYPARSFGDSTLPGSVRAVVLDGSGATACLRDVKAPVVFCIVDRSVADESAAEDILQYRNTRGEPVSLAGRHRAAAPAGRGSARVHGGPVKRASVPGGAPPRRAEAAAARYAASVALARDGAEVIAVDDPHGSCFNAAAWELLRASRDDPGLWDDLLLPVRALRSRLLTQPRAAAPGPAVSEAAGEVARQARALRRAVDDPGLLDRVTAAAQTVGEAGSPVGEALLRALDDGGRLVIVAASVKSKTALASWLDGRGARVLTAGELGSYDGRADRVCVVGPPRFFRSSLVTAPAAGRMCFLVPSWFRDLSVPRSPFAAHAEGAIEVKARVRRAARAGGPVPCPAGAGPEDDLLPPAMLPAPPQPAWPAPPAGQTAAHGEVAAQKVLLSGGLAMWLDDGERIRVLDPGLPEGERVTTVTVQEVRQGTCLLLREGQSDQDVLRAAAFGLLGHRAAEVRQTQEHWKARLADLIAREGELTVAGDLADLGAEHAGQAWAWTDPRLIRPRSDTDFRTVLEWLDIPVEPSFGNADLLRKATAQASADIRGYLEDAISAADLSELGRSGHLTLDGRAEGFRGMIATRVLAVAPGVTFVPRGKARVPLEDRTAQWLE